MRNRSTIYLDSNIYIAIVKKESGHLRWLNKLKELKQRNVVFPHAPPHAEEAVALIRRDPSTARQFIKLVRRFDGNAGLLPGLLNEEDTAARLAEFTAAAESDPRLADAANIHARILVSHQQGRITRAQMQTQLVQEDFIDCMLRVEKHLALTDVATESDLYHLGRRSQKQMNANFDELGVPSDAVDAFEKVRETYKLEPKRLANVRPTDLLNDLNFRSFALNEIGEYGLDLHALPSAEHLLSYHHAMESAVTALLNLMEKAGYHQEKKNHKASLVGRMHDVSHVVYASAAEYLVTDDARLATKSAATFHALGLPTSAIGVEEFLTL